MTKKVNPKNHERYAFIKKEITRLADELYLLAETEGYKSKLGQAKIEELLSLYKEKQGLNRFFNPKDYAMVKFLSKALEKRDDEAFKKNLKPGKS